MRVCIHNSPAHAIGPTLVRVSWSTHISTHPTSPCTPADTLTHVCTYHTHAHSQQHTLYAASMKKITELQQALEKAKSGGWVEGSVYDLCRSVGM